MIAVAPAVAAAHALLAFNVPRVSQPARRCGDLIMLTTRNVAWRSARLSYRRQQLQPQAFPRSRASGVSTAALGESSGDQTTRYSPARAGPHRLPLKHIPQTCLVVVDEATGCDIYLVGCLHGSRASGRDVKEVLDRVRPGAVVLELCESRHRSLRRDLEMGREEKEGPPSKMHQVLLKEIKCWAKGVRSTMKKAGLAQGLLAALLSAPYLLQRLGDFDPGLEFKTAIAYTDASSRQVLPEENSSQFSDGAGALASEGGGEGCTLVLGDRDVHETLRRIGGGRLRAIESDDGKDSPPSGGRTLFSLNSEGGGGGQGEGKGSGDALGFSAGQDGGIQDLPLLSLISPSDWNMVSDARVLRLAVVGPQGSKWPDSLNVFDTIWRERQALGGLLLPVLLVLTVMMEAVQRSVGGAALVAMAATGGQSHFGSGPVLGSISAWQVELERLADTASEFWDAAFVLLAAWYTLRFFRLVIKERDDVLAESIIKACREHPGRPVVAVLGLLHCNGVADNLRRFAAAEQDDEKGTLVPQGSGDAQ